MQQDSKTEPLHLLGLNGRVGAIPTYRVYRLYDTLITIFLWVFVIFILHRKSQTPIENTDSDNLC